MELTAKTVASISNSDSVHCQEEDGTVSIVVLMPHSDRSVAEEGDLVTVRQ